MKDIVFIVVDSLMADHVFSRKNGVQLTPFMDSIKENVVFAKNIFAQGPFTEAGTKGLLTSSDTLDDGGYLFRFDGAETFITSEFKKAGFETYSVTYPTCLYSDWMCKDIDQMYYTSDLMFDVFWSQKFISYANAYRNGIFDQHDEDDVIKLLYMIFVAWTNFLNPQDKECRIMLAEYVDENVIAEQYAVVLCEYEKFNKNRREYAVDLLVRGEEHPLNQIRSSFLSDIIRNEAITKAFDKNKEFQRLFIRKQRNYNFKNNKPDKYAIKRIIGRLDGKINKYSFGEILYWIQNMFRGGDLKRMKKGHDYKLLLSAKKQLSKVAEIVTDTHDVPRFVMAHIEEPHYFNTFYTYDSDDVELIDKEIKYAKEYVEQISRNYKGYIGYDLAIRYVDNAVKEMFETIEAAGRLENTIVVITADHGSSYNFAPSRGRAVNNCHTENYRIPFVLYDKSLCGREIEWLGMSKDILPTILEYIGISVSNKLKGKSLLSDEPPHSFVITEYMGPGCPDFRRNKACITIRDGRYLLLYEGFLTEEFTEENITEIYDTLVDEEEINNIYKKRNSEIELLISEIKKRFENIKNNNSAWIKCKF